MHNNPVTPAIIQTALATAYLLGAARSASEFDALISLDAPNPRTFDIPQMSLLLHWVYCRNLEIARHIGDEETAVKPADSAYNFAREWAFAAAWNTVYRRENVIADYLYARAVQFTGNGDLSQENPLAINTPFDSILPPELRAMLDVIALSDCGH